MMIYINTKI